MRLIDADEIRKKAVPHTRGDFGRYNSDIRKWAVLVGDIDDAPTVDAVEVVHGYWLYYSSTMQECSNCHRHTARHKFKYCPHCGAVMEGKYNDG